MSDTLTREIEILKLMNTYEIRKSLQTALKHIDKNGYVFLSTINHLETQCSDMEVEMIENDILDLNPIEYDTVEEFLIDYQPIFDLVDFPFKDCFHQMRMRTLNYDAL